MRKKKSKVRYDNLFLIAFIVILVILLIITGIMAKRIIGQLRGGSDDKEVAVVEKMDNYQYQLTENHTEYFKTLYYELKDLLSADKQEDFEEQYASLVARLFVADFFDLNSKLDKTDVGGVQFVWENYREDFKNFATDVEGIYYYVENNVYGKRTQKLPSVKEVEVKEIEQIHYSKNNVIDDNAYRVTLSISYEVDLGYPKSCTVTILHNKDKLEIIDME